jgi:hypothetical protein
VPGDGGTEHHWVGGLGILGILIGPLALSYFFELIRMYRESYVDDEGSGPATEEAIATN